MKKILFLLVALISLTATVQANTFEKQRTKVDTHLQMDVTTPTVAMVTVDFDVPDMVTQTDTNINLDLSYLQIQTIDNVITYSYVDIGREPDNLYNYNYNKQYSNLYLSFYESVDADTVRNVSNQNSNTNISKSGLVVNVSYHLRTC